LSSRPKASTEYLDTTGLDQMIFVGQASLRRAVTEFVSTIMGSAITKASAIA
jgi:hypothetical protein